ncbi:hypothetical protein F5887DRAFT_918607 [Amanita rubescens]|nr:hypothetical protein F5887DRAFT_918607 [Amanita rubescens]
MALSLLAILRQNKSRQCMGSSEATQPITSVRHGPPSQSPSRPATNVQRGKLASYQEQRAIAPRLADSSTGQKAEGSETDLIDSVHDLKSRNRIFGELLTIDEMLDPPEERENADSDQYDGHTDVVMAIVEEVRDEISVEKGETIEVQSDDEDNDLQANKLLSRTSLISLCTEIQTSCLQYGDPQLAFELLFRVPTVCIIGMSTVYSDDEEYYDDEMFVSDDEMDMDADGDDFKVAPKTMRKAYEIDYRSLSQTEVEKQMRADVEYICNILGVEVGCGIFRVLILSGPAAPPPLLPAVRRDPLQANYLDFLVQNGPLVPHLPSRILHPRYMLCRGIPNTLLNWTSLSHVPYTMTICPTSQPFCLTADTRSATPACWNMFLVSKIRDEGEHVVRYQLVAPDPFVRDILIPTDASASGIDPEQQKENVQIWARFQELLAHNFVGSKKELKYCPYPGCTNTVSCPSAASKFSLTNCSHCVLRPARGSRSRRSERNRAYIGFGDEGTQIKSNMKECGNCQSTIEKNGGCNHMTCKKCKHEFCWVCMVIAHIVANEMTGPWSETAWYSCNRYDEKAGVDTRDTQSRSRARLERYLHAGCLVIYYNRWANHEQSAKVSRDPWDQRTNSGSERRRFTFTLDHDGSCWITMCHGGSHWITMGHGSHAASNERLADSTFEPFAHRCIANDETGGTRALRLMRSPLDHEIDEVQKSGQKSLKRKASTSATTRSKRPPAATTTSTRRKMIT